MLKKRLKSFKYAFQGLRDLLLNQPNARIHLAAAVLVIAAGLLFSLSAAEWSLVALAMALVFTAEAFNTALEYITDLVSPEHHGLAGKAKDAAAAAVLTAAFGAAAAGLLIFLPKIIALMQGS